MVVDRPGIEPGKDGLQGLPAPLRAARRVYGARCMESNPRPTAYKAGALPTELTRQFYLVPHRRLELRKFRF